MVESIADTLAQNDVDSNKQSYANSNGKCNCVENCDCNLAGEVNFSGSNGEQFIHVTYTLDVIPKGNCSTMKNYLVSFDLNTGASHDIYLQNDTSSNTGSFDMEVPVGTYDLVSLDVGTQCGGYNTVSVTKQ